MRADAGRMRPRHPEGIGMIARRIGAALAVIVALTGAPMAQELRIGVAEEPGALDPQYQDQRGDAQVALHIFEALVARDTAMNLRPALAESWRALDDTTWEFKLRAGVTFHDGSAFTADDVVFTIERAAKLPNAPAPFTPHTRQIAGIEVVDPLTVRLRTATPAPLLPVDMAAIRILSKTAASGPAPEGKTTDALNRGEGLVGTGPYKFLEWSRGSQIVLERNDAYWGTRPAWQRVILRLLPNATARATALLAGEVDLVEDPPTADLPALARNERVHLAQAPTNRIIYIHLDQFAEPSPGLPMPEGRNPLKDRRVRQALLLALDRNGLVSRVKEGYAVPAAELLPAPMFGTTPDATVGRRDVARARQLLAEAGYPDGFVLTLAGPSGRYDHDVRVAEAVAAMWTEAGIKTQLVLPTPAVFFRNRDEHKYSAYLSRWTAVTGEMSHVLSGLVATPSRERGLGGGNRGRYSNPALDAKLAEALRSVDDDKRRALLQEASRLVIDDAGILPLYAEVAVWAMRRGLAYAARADRLTLAQHVTAVQ
ncbi:MAG TPA: ABC transporter substrate-binding protein [Vineibacter sp.]|nr:ABC transporter substrate-binding protein [Vineibacter sp.]